MTLAIHRFRREGKFHKDDLDGFLSGKSWPLVEGSQVTFVYRGYVDRVAIQHWIFGLESAQEFQRLGESDLWYLVMELPANSRVEYKYWVEKEGARRLLNDPLNPHLARDPFGANSVCHTEGYLIPDWVEADPEAREGSLHELVIPHTQLGSGKTVQIYLPARFRRTRRYPLLVVHDGFDYLRFASLKTVLDNLIHRGEVAPLIAVLTQSDDRLREYAGHQPHAQFIAQDLVPLLEGRLPLRGRPDSRCLMGASFGGVASLSTAWYFPGMFGRLLLQSGSFAFTDIGNHKRSPAFDPVVAFMNRFRETPGRPSEKAFVCCGTYESLIYENRSMVPFLQGIGVEVRYREARDGHNWEHWRDRLREGLSFLYPGQLWFIYE